MGCTETALRLRVSRVAKRTPVAPMGCTETALRHLPLEISEAFHKVAPMGCTVTALRLGPKVLCVHSMPKLHPWGALELRCAESARSQSRALQSCTHGVHWNCVAPVNTSEQRRQRSVAPMGCTGTALRRCSGRMMLEPKEVAPMGCTGTALRRHRQKLFRVNAPGAFCANLDFSTGSNRRNELILRPILHKIKLLPCLLTPRHFHVHLGLAQHASNYEYPVKIHGCKCTVFFDVLTRGFGDAVEP